MELIDRKLAELEARHAQLVLEISQPLPPQQLAQKSKQIHDITPFVTLAAAYRQVQADICQASEWLHDSEYGELAAAELPLLKEKRDQITQELEELLLGVEDDDHRNVIVEFRAGTGGEEASLFAADLMRMILRYAERNNWQASILNFVENTVGGCREAIVSINGQGVYGKLKFESGVHRVQRVPETEASGRIHTSAATVAVLPEAEDVDISISPSDLRIDTFRSQGAGGQHVNTTDSAVRITHLPSGIVVQCQDEKSQHKNRERAMKVLRARLFEAEKRQQDESRASTRKNIIKSGDRSERIRTYNFPQSRITDHRIGLTINRISDVLAGDLDLLIEPLMQAHNAERLAQAAETT